MIVVGTIKSEIRSNIKNLDILLENAEKCELTYDNFENILKKIPKAAYPQNISVKRQLQLFLEAIKSQSLLNYQVEIFTNHIPGNNKKKSDCNENSNFCVKQLETEPTIDEQKMEQNKSYTSKAQQQLRKSLLIKQIMTVYSMPVRHQMRRKKDPSSTIVRKTGSSSLEPKPKPPEFPPLGHEMSFTRKGAKLYEISSSISSTRGQSEMGMYMENNKRKSYSTIDPNDFKPSIRGISSTHSSHKPSHSSQGVYGDFSTLQVSNTKNSYLGQQRYVKIKSFHKKNNLSMDTTNSQSPSSISQSNKSLFIDNIKNDQIPKKLTTSHVFFLNFNDFLEFNINNRK